MSLAFRHAIVVGASSGIGAEIARQLAAGGCAVALLGRRAEELERIRASIAGSGRGSALVQVHDVRSCDEVPSLLDQLIKKLGELDLHVYAAGTMYKPGESEIGRASCRERV